MCFSPAPGMLGAGTYLGSNTSRPGEVWPLSRYQIAPSNPCSEIQGVLPSTGAARSGSNAVPGTHSVISRIHEWMADGSPAMRAPITHLSSDSRAPRVPSLPLASNTTNWNRSPSSLLVRQSVIPATASHRVIGPTFSETSQPTAGELHPEGEQTCAMMETPLNPGHKRGSYCSFLTVDGNHDGESDWDAGDEPEPGAVACNDSSGKGWLRSSPHLLDTPSPQKQRATGGDWEDDGTGEGCKRLSGVSVSVRSSLLRAPPGSACTASKQSVTHTMSSAGSGERELSCMSHSRRVSQVLAAAAFRNTSQLFHSHASSAEQQPSEQHRHRRQYSIGSDCSMGGAGDGGMGSAEKGHRRHGLCFTSGGREAAGIRRVRNAGCTPAGAGAAAGLLHCVGDRGFGHDMEDDGDMYDEGELLPVYETLVGSFCVLWGDLLADMFGCVKMVCKM